MNMTDCRYIIRTDDGRYVKADGRYVKADTTAPTEFTKTVWAAKFYKNEDDAKMVVAGAYRWLEKYGKVCGGSWPSVFVVVKATIKEQ